MSHIISKPNRFIKPRFEWKPRHIPNHPLSQGLIAHWLLNEGVGLTAYDISGKLCHGTLTGFDFSGNSNWSTGRFGGALSFYVTDYVQFSDLSFDYSITVSAWVYCRDFNATTFNSKANSTGFHIFATRLSDSDKSPTLCISSQGSPSGMCIVFVCDAPNTALGAKGTTTLTINTWYHVVGTFNYTGSGSFQGDWDVYLNGRRDNPSTNNFILVGSVSFPFNKKPLIGNHGAWPSTQFSDGSNGIIDDVRVYNRALSPQEIWQLYTDPFCDLEVPVYRKYWYVTEEAPSFNPAWAKQSNVFIGSGAIL